MAQRKSPSYPEWPVDRSVYSLFCGACRLVAGVNSDLATPPQGLRSVVAHLRCAYHPRGGMHNEGVN